MQLAKRVMSFLSALRSVFLMLSVIARFAQKRSARAAVGVRNSASAIRADPLQLVRVGIIDPK